MSGQTSHLDRVRDDTAYAEILANWDAAFYAKFTAALRPEVTGGRVLDVGCGVGQVVAQLAADGVDAWGVDVAEANIAKSRAHTDRCLWYDGKRLPFPDRHFAGVGALNVLEHVEAPEDFIADVVRVTAPGGKIVLSSPNFLRAIGWRDYHPRMRGLGNKWRNFRALADRRRKMRACPEAVRFVLQRNGCVVETVSCTDRVVDPLVEAVLNATPLRYAMFNAFVVARKK